MSLILEALRKSEAERRRGSAPDVALELPPATVARTRSAPAWLLPALVAVAIAILVALWWWQRGPATPATTAPPAVETPAPAVAPAVVARPQPQAATPPTVATSAPQAPPPSPTAPTAPARIAPPPAIPTPAPAPAPAPASAEVADIDASGLPPVRLSMHMWDPSPARRFVILDGQRMAEGDRIGDLGVVAIERGGVVIERNGQRARISLP